MGLVTWIKCWTSKIRAYTRFDLVEYQQPPIPKQLKIDLELWLYPTLSEPICDSNRSSSSFLANLVVNLPSYRFSRPLFMFAISELRAINHCIPFWSIVPWKVVQFRYSLQAYVSMLLLWALQHVVKWTNNSLVEKGMWKSQRRRVSSILEQVCFSLMV